MGIRKSKYSKQHMKLDPLTSAYLKVIEENASNGAVDATKSQVDKTFGDSANDKNVKPKTDGLENVDLEKVEEAPAELTSAGSESEPKEVKKGEKLSLKGESSNPFDALFNKIISEDTFDFSTEADNQLTPDSDFGGPDAIGSVSHEDESEHEFDHEDEEFDEETEESLEDILGQLKDLVSKLEKHIGGDEEESEEESEEEEEYEEPSEEEEHEEVKEEAVEAEEVGHALVDQEKLESGLTKKGSHTVKGAVPVTKKKAEVVKGKKVTGEPEECKSEGGVSSLQGKNNNVGGVQTGKGLFEQN